MKKITKLLLFIIPFVGIGIAYAIYGTSFEKENEFKTGKVDVDIEEIFYSQFGTKEVSFVNKSPTTSAVLRIYYNEISLDDSGIVNILANGVDKVTKNWTQEFLRDFQYNDDGWYYYKKVLLPNSSIKVLNSIINSNETSGTYELIFNYEAVQASSAAIQDVWGINATIEGSDVIWP